MTMKKTILPLFFAGASIALFAFRSELISTNQVHKTPLNGGGAGAGKTGAPGESNCTSCHSGSTQNGDTENILTVLDANNNPVTSYTAGATYTVTLGLNSNPSKKGFQATALKTSDNTMAGTFTATSGNTSVNGGVKKYANHTSQSNTSATALWTWTWTAPTTNVGDVKFYVASNKANGNNQNSNDVIYLSQHTILAPSNVGIEENSFKPFFKAAYNAETNSLVLNYQSLKMNKVHVNIVDLSGKSVFHKSLGVSAIGANIEHVSLPTDLPKGYYVVNLFLNNTAMSAKVFVQ
jgi:hypothetical protein